MIRGYWERRYEKDCESIYLVDREKGLSYSLNIIVHKKESTMAPHKSTDFDSEDGTGILKALAEALQMGGYIPQAANDAELKATKYHLEDMRKLTLSD